jgi:hypothetical protein
MKTWKEAAVGLFCDCVDERWSPAEEDGRCGYCGKKAKKMILVFVEDDDQGHWIKQ